MSKKQIFYIALLFLLPFMQAEAKKIVWADTVVNVSYEYGYSKNTKAYKAFQVLGKPSTLPGIDNETECSWAPARDDGGTEFIEVAYSSPIIARQVAIVQNLNPGAITNVELFGKSGEELVIFSDSLGFKNRDYSKPLCLFFKPAKKPVSRVRLTLNTALVQGYNQIDAIALSDSEEPVEVNINVVQGAEQSNNREVLSDAINSKAKELLPQITPDGRVLFFTRENHIQNYGYINGIAAQDIWYSEMDSVSNFKPAVMLEPPLNNNMNNSVCSITPDGQQALLLNIYNKDGTMSNGISMSLKSDSIWQFPTPLVMKNFYNLSQYGEFCLSSSGRVIVMTVQRDDSYGSKDCYVSFLEKDSTWSEPLNMGTDINTGTSEVSPFLAADEKTLYYSTSGLPGYGKQDIFITRRLDDTWTRWSEPQNLGPKINSSNFDAYYSIQASGEYAYFSSSNGANLEDIFRIKLPEKAKPNPVVLVRGYVYNSKDKKPVQAQILYESLSTGKEIGEAHSESTTGYYSIILPAGEKYGFRAKAKGFASINQNIDLSDLKSYEEINRDLILVPLETGQTVRLNNIFFEYDKFDITPETKPELDRLVSLMKEYPEMTIMISGHTDDHGTDNYNMILSNNRAKSVYDYIIASGISDTRLSYQGFGESKPVAPNTDDQGRQLNRRVEFMIIKM